jgi:hypothetical protein
MNSDNPTLRIYEFGQPCEYMNSDNPTLRIYEFGQPYSAYIWIRTTLLCVYMNSDNHALRSYEFGQPYTLRIYEWAGAREPVLNLRFLSHHALRLSDPMGVDYRVNGNCNHHMHYTLHHVVTSTQRALCYIHIGKVPRFFAVVLIGSNPTFLPLCYHRQCGDLSSHYLS